MSGAAYLAVFGAGVASFGSPCVLPLVPVYLGVVAGEGTQALSTAAVRAAVVFVGGFSVVFVSLGALAGGIGNALAQQADAVARVGGAVVALLGIALIAPRLGVVPRERRLITTVRSVGPMARPFVAGVAFGAAWTPCVGPLLGASLVVAAQEDAWRGAALLSVYSLGVGVPFVVAALAAASWPSFAMRYARVGHRFEVAGGVVLVAVGVSLAAGWYNHLIDPLIPK